MDQHHQMWSVRCYMHWALYIESWPEANLLWAAIDHALQQWARYQTQWVAQKYSMQFSILLSLVYLLRHLHLQCTAHIMLLSGSLGIHA